ncbi:hypothetical protein [Aeromonas caviae]|uniref:hypothetical protein n=1 Tax=Aeromonas caviae TaxID=648 RepID=UPI002B250309|nr:hypothetical protein [Aeromonas caviae]MEA9428085.1 hypothetical protein [Aeromonas caviae]MEA9433958.1 hypothetical protein [Aeromonas caviae]
MSEGYGGYMLDIAIQMTAIWGRLQAPEIRGRLRKRKIKHVKEVTSFSTSFVAPDTADAKRETEKRLLFGLSEGCSAGCPAIQPIADQSDPRS